MVGRPAGGHRRQDRLRLLADGRQRRHGRRGLAERLHRLPAVHPGGAVAGRQRQLRGRRIRRRQPVRGDRQLRLQDLQGPGHRPGQPRQGQVDLDRAQRHRGQRDRVHRPGRGGAGHREQQRHRRRHARRRPHAVQDLAGHRQVRRLARRQRRPGRAQRAGQQGHRLSDAAQPGRQQGPGAQRHRRLQHQRRQAEVGRQARGQAGHPRDGLRGRPGARAGAAGLRRAGPAGHRRPGDRGDEEVRRLRRRLQGPRRPVRPGELPLLAQRALLPGDPHRLRGQRRRDVPGRVPLTARPTRAPPVGRQPGIPGDSARLGARACGASV
ncbi:putative Glutamate N-acetyltransferase @ N-acetylglutamate synthase [Actinacidiphila bryophytorum]|uniref:Glutamate N-acetyltransferase @ N-acetylglutamate synthase n=1 Tax=Actinacidiphila bryophytorum TaxID=1436133 RepID=A0A9W4M8X9_9ACTN|nr:putative Glutamate N-acetyltransferase @ N-acetylglutamate synthase [Actinacidiphila bryophytorum]